MLFPLLLVCFVLSVEASSVFHGSLSLSSASSFAPGSLRFKRQLGFQSNNCVNTCVNALSRTITNLGMETSATGFLNSKLYQPTTFDSFCRGFQKWSTCSDNCPYSQVKNILKTAFRPLESLCGEDREEFESYQSCYRDSDAEQNQVCDTRCGGQDVVKKEMAKLTMGSRDLRTILRILNKSCRMTACHIDCRMPIIFETCRNRDAALFIGLWSQKVMSQALAPLEPFGLDIQCDAVVDFNPDDHVFEISNETS